MSKKLDELLARSAALHHHLCPRQVLGVQMGRYAAELLGLDLPQTDKRLLTIVETDGCFADGVAVAAGCWVGRRTLRVEDYGKVAATFVDTQTEHGVRISPRPDSRQQALVYAPSAPSTWEAMLHGYQRMPLAELFTVERVALMIPVATIISLPGLRTICDRCGEEIMNGREINGSGQTLCRACAFQPYYRVACTPE
ncbi:MAG: TraR/DksA C4-type zinc finger protein [Anaerolineales bacterium]|nr:TraR/DksA C4-type zinc finger protein [Anaerolineales bacterium]